MKKCIILFALTILSAIIFNVNCFAAEKTQQRLDTCDGMIAYLQKMRLPALKSVRKWENSYGEGIVITTKHYEIYTTLLEPLMLVQVPGFIESAYRGYQKQLPEPIETKTKFTIYMFAHRKQWESFTREFAPQQAEVLSKIKSGAYYHNGSCVVYNIGRDTTFSVLGHEGWHQFNSRHFKFRLPSWLDEGIAMLFETSRYEKGMFYFEPGNNLSRLGGLKKVLLSGKVISLKSLIGMNPGEVLIMDENTDHWVMAFYCQSYALTRFLREDDYGKRLAGYHNMLLDGLNGNWPLNETEQTIASNRNIPLTVRWNKIVAPMLFDEYIGPDRQKIEKEYMNFCRKIVYHIRFGK